MSGMSVMLRMSGETERHDGNYRNGRGISECGECQQFLEWREYQECLQCQERPFQTHKIKVI